MPLQHKDALPNVHAQVFEISCLEGMQERSSLAVDARGAYLADWDKGYPDPNQDYEDLQRIHVENGGWPFAIRPRCKMNFRIIADLQGAVSRFGLCGQKVFFSRIHTHNVRPHWQRTFQRGTTPRLSTPTSGQSIRRTKCQIWI